MNWTNIVIMTILTDELELRAGAKAEGLVEAIDRAIGRGALKPGERLPTQRELARELGVSLGTVTRAYAQARRRGLIHGEVGRGTFVSRRGVENWRFLTDARPPVEIDLSMNRPVRCGEADEAAFTSAMEELLGEADGRRLLNAFWRELEPRHRAIGAAWCARSGWEVDPARVLVGPGFHPTLLAAVRLAMRPGDLLLTESLTYPGIKPIAGAAGVPLRAVPMDEEGLIPEALEVACRESGAKLLYCRPTHHIATTATQSLERRRRVAEIVVERGLTLIEDDEEFALLEDPLPPIASLAPEHTIFIAGLNRALALGLGTCYVVTPAAMRQELDEAIDEVTWMKVPLLAEISARWIEGDQASRLIAARREEVVARQELATRLFAGRTVQSSPLAHHLWLTLPEPWSADAFLSAVARRGVALAPTGAFFVGRGAVPRAVRVCLGAPPDREALETALERLIEVLECGPERTRAIF